MAKKLNWKRNLPLSSDKSFLNTSHWFVPSDFVPTDLPQDYLELCCDYLNKIRIEYVTLRNNGEPKSSYKPDVKEKISSKKEERLEKKQRKVRKFMKYNNLVLKDSFNRLDKNNKPDFKY